MIETMRTDKQLYKLLGASPEVFRLLTGVKLKGEYHIQSVTFKELALTCDGLNVPLDDDLPIYVVETQAQKDDCFLDRLLMEILLARRNYPGRVVHGLPVFLDRSADTLGSPWRKWLGCEPLLAPVYLDGVLDELRTRDPGHPLLAACLPLTAKDNELELQAPGAWELLKSADIPCRKELENVFLSWILERFKNKSLQEIKTMLQMMTPLEETRAYKEIVAIGWEKGKLEGKLEGELKGKLEGELKGKLEEARNILSRQIQRRFGDLPEWVPARLAKAKATQLEKWAEEIFDAGSVDELLDRRR